MQRKRWIQVYAKRLCFFVAFLNSVKYVASLKTTKKLEPFGFKSVVGTYSVPESSRIGSIKS